MLDSSKNMLGLGHTTINKNTTINMNNTNHVADGSGFLDTVTNQAYSAIDNALGNETRYFNEAGYT